MCSAIQPKEDIIPTYLQCNNLVNKYGTKNQSEKTNSGDVRFEPAR